MSYDRQELALRLTLRRAIDQELEKTSELAKKLKSTTKLLSNPDLTKTQMNHLLRVALQSQIHIVPQAVADWLADQVQRGGSIEKGWMFGGLSAHLIYCITGEIAREAPNDYAHMDITPLPKRAAAIVQDYPSLSPVEAEICGELTRQLIGLLRWSSHHLSNTQEN